MYASLNWLGRLLGTELDPQETAERLTVVGATVDAVEPVHAELGDVVIGLVEHVGKHPNADRLTLCRVSTGKGTVEVVCGAPNVRAGMKYPYAAAGAVLPGGFKLERRKIRGVASNGMLCSAKELGLGADQDGILELDTVAAPGTPLLEALDLADTRLEVDVTPNRPDLLAQRGIARELAAAMGLTVKLPAFEGAPAVPAARRVKRSGSVGGIEVIVEDDEGCPRYGAAVIRGVRIGPSPEWLQARLRSVGARPINNVVDATNYILHEINQPLHAFDINALRGGKLIIRRANDGERITTLDGEDHPLTPEMTMICDADGAIAIAGVMGGENTEVSDETTDILLECAYFDRRRIRATRMALRMDTDASYRFERGTDLEGLPAALRRAVELIIAVAGGEEPEAAIDVCPRLPHPTTVFLRPSRVEHLLGVAVPQDEIERLLGSVGFTLAPRDGRLAVQVPGWRPDVAREVDLIEEVARLRGYDSFPVEMRPFRPTTVPDAPSELRSALVRQVLTALGIHEARTLPLGPAGGEHAQPVQNPLSSEETHLRTDLLPGLVRSVERNWSARARDIRLFEIGRVFRATTGATPPVETLRIAVVLTGARQPGHWAELSGIDFDLWDLKGMLEEVVGVAAPGGAAVAPDGADGWAVTGPDGTVLGRGGELDADGPPWAAPLFGIEIDLAVAETPAVRYRALPTTPAIERDLALVLPATVAAEDVEEMVRGAGGSMLESVAVFDEYRAKELVGRSVAWRLVFRDPSRTLRDAEVDRSVNRILRALKERLGVERRES
ncbi:MAG: phenylalanine--tRNA ligase subunit beta [Gemmatimonadales bacterium]